MTRLWCINIIRQRSSAIYTCIVSLASDSLMLSTLYGVGSGGSVLEVGRMADVTAQLFYQSLPLKQEMR